MVGHPLARLVGPEAQGHGIWKPLGGGADTPGCFPEGKAKLVADFWRERGPGCFVFFFFAVGK